MSSIIKNRIQKIIIALIRIALWQIIAMIIDKEILLPTPLAVSKSFISLLWDKTFYLSIISTVFKIFIGFMISLVMALVLSYISYRSKLFYDFIHPVILIFRTIPLASIVILLLFWINTKNLSIYISFIMAMPIIYSNIYTGLNSIDYKLLEMTDIYKVSEIKKIRYLYFIKIRPYLVSSILTVSGLVFKSGIAAEVIGLSKNSIGINLYNSKVYLDMPQLFARSVAILIISLVFEFMLKKILGVYDGGI